MKKSMLGAVLVAAVMALGTGASANIVTNVLYDWTQPYTADANTWALYHFDGGTGTNVLDSSGSNRHLHFSPDLAADSDVWISGDTGFGDAVLFPSPPASDIRRWIGDGSHTFDTRATARDSWSIQMRINPTTFTASDYFWALGSSIGPAGALMIDTSLTAAVNSITNLNFFCWGDAAWRNFNIELSQPLVTGVWQEVTFIYRHPDARDAYNEQFQVWVNGALVGSGTAEWNLTGGGGAGIHIGHSADGSWFRQYEGAMDEFRIYDGVVASIIPEPSTGLLGLLGLLLLFIRRHPR